MAITIGESSLVQHMLYNIGKLNEQSERTMTRLSTGLRINQAKDDPSGVVALAAMNSDLTAVNAAIDNNERSQAVLDTADATLMEIKNITQEIERLALAAQDPNATTAEIGAYQASVDQHLDTIDTLIRSASFNGSALFTGTNAITIASGDVNMDDPRCYQADGDATANKVFQVSYVVATGVVTVDGTQVGSAANDGDEIFFTKDGYSCSFTIEDAGTALLNDTLTITFGEGALFQLGADSTTQTRLDMAAGITIAELGDSVGGYLKSLRTGSANALDQAGTSAATIAAKATKQVAMAAARVGSFNTFQVGSSLASLEATKQGMTSMISKIQDTDYTEETALLDRQNVLMNAAVSMLGMANTQRASSVLALLQYSL